MKEIYVLLMIHINLKQIVKSKSKLGEKLTECKDGQISGEGVISGSTLDPESPWR